jgi:predicted Zn-dependent peptidase
VKQTLYSAILDNGIILLGEELPDLESVAVAFHVPAGGIHDGPGRCGLASLTSEMMLRGAGTRDSRGLIEDFAMAGINWSNAVSTTHATYFGAMVARRLHHPPAAAAGGSV